MRGRTASAPVAIVEAALDERLSARIDRSLARRRVTERIFVEQRADKRFAELTDEQIRASIDKFLDAEGFEG